MNIKLTDIAQWATPLRLGIFFAVLVASWIPLALPIYLLFNDRYENIVSIATMSLLLINFLILVPVWSRCVYGQTRVWHDCGLRSPARLLRPILQGWSLGCLFMLSFATLNLGMGWAIAQPIKSNFVPIILEGILLGIGVAFAEELFFRGWLLDELERDYSPRLSLGLNATIFALLHFLKPLPEVVRTFPQFPALILLGLALVWARRGGDRNLGLAMGLHGGLVGSYYWLNVGQLMTYSGTVSPLVTGIDRNPLSGLTGILLLSVLAAIMAYQIKPYKTKANQNP